MSKEKVVSIDALAPKNTRIFPIDRQIVWLQGTSSEEDRNFTIKGADSDLRETIVKKLRGRGTFYYSNDFGNLEAGVSGYLEQGLPPFVTFDDAADVLSALSKEPPKKKAIAKSIP